jgi:hypothetical protein
MALIPKAANRIAFTQMRLGFAVDRATAALPQTAQSALFTVAGGRIAVLGIIGEVTTVIQTQANNTKIVANPTTGTDVDLCAVLSITAKEVGTLFGITGTFADAMVGANAGATVMPDRPVVVPIGTIDLSCAASNTGSVKWRLIYLPIDDGATVTAA